MIHRSDPDIVKRLNLFGAAAAIFSMMVGLSVLAGWTLNIAALLTWGAGTPMAPNAAACFVLAGFSLWLLREKEKRPSLSGGKLAARAAAAIVSLAGLLTLMEHLLKRDFRIDRLLLLRPPGLQIASFRIVMSPVTAGAFLLFGLALLGIDWRTKHRYWVAQFFCLPACIAPVFALLGLLWGPSVSPITVPVPTGIAFLALVAGLLCSRRSWAIGGLLTHRSPGTTFLRRALPSGMLVLGIIGWLISKPLLTEVHFTWVEVSALAIVTGALLVSFIVWTAIVVDRSDGQRRKLEEVLQLGQVQMDRLLEQVEARGTDTRIDVSVTISPIRDGDGTVVGASRIARDITQRKRVEDALRDSEESLRLALDGGRLGTWQWKLETDALEGSAVSMTLFGLPPNAEFNFAGFRAVLHPQDRALVDEAMARCLAGLGEYDVEYRTLLPDRTERWVAARGQAYKSAGNEITHVRGVVSDITDRRQAQEALRESKERFQIMANGIQQLAWMAEADGSVFWYNQRWYDYTGTSPGQAEGWTWEQIHDPAVLPEVLHGWKKAIADGTPFDMEFPLRGADGSFRMFLTRVMPVRNAEGRVVRWLGTNTDISERKKAEEDLARLAVELGQKAEDLAHSQEALEGQKIMLQSVLNSMVEGLVAADAQGKFILWNPAAEKIIGLGAADLSPGEWGAHYGTYLPDKVTPFPDEENPLRRAIGGELSSAEIFIRNPGLNQGAWIEANGAPLRDKDGAVVGGVVAFRDITQRRADELEIRRFNEELEERIAERTAQLETANHELEAFSYSVSHDLRAPLRHIGGFARILMNDFGSGMEPEAKDLLQRINDAVIRMGTLVDGLLSLAKLGRQSLKVRPTDLNVIVAEAISVLQPECEGREIEWRIAQLPALECDGVLMGQVFQNLLGNAVKYSRGRTKAVIEVGSIQEAGQPAVVFVRDNGAGFNMQYAEKLFGVFQRMHTEEEFEGTGVGLATVQRIIQKHGGGVWAEAETDHGATFYFTLGGNGERRTAPRLIATAR